MPMKAAVPPELHARRKEHPALTEGELKWVEGGSEAVLAFYRTSERESVLAIHNLSSEDRVIRIEPEHSQPNWTDLLSGQVFATKQNLLELNLTPHQYLWLK